MRRGAALLVLLALCGCAAARDVLTPYAPNEAERRDVLAQPRPAKIVDAAIVLGCPAEESGRPSMCQLCRVYRAVEEYRAGGARNLVFTGAAAHNRFVEADTMAAVAVAHGVPPERVSREPRALTTWQNLRYSTQLARDRGWKTVLIISTSDHLARARRVARFWGLDDAHTGYAACDDF